MVYGGLAGMRRPASTINAGGKMIIHWPVVIAGVLLLLGSMRLERHRGRLSLLLSLPGNVLIVLGMNGAIVSRLFYGHP